LDEELIFPGILPDLSPELGETSASVSVTRRNGAADLQSVELTEKSRRGNSVKSVSDFSHKENVIF
jgi:hypothetical protein